MSKKRSRRYFSEGYKRAIVRRLREGESVSDIVAEEDIRRASVYQWKQSFPEELGPAAETTEIDSEKETEETMKETTTEKLCNQAAEEERMRLQKKIDALEACLVDADQAILTLKNALTIALTT